MWSQIVRNPDILVKLKSSRFRRKFLLDNYDKYMINRDGLSGMEEYAYKIVRERLVVQPENDGKQTPYRGHPVFKAQHATATCCRGCIEKWHRIPRYKELDKKEIDFVVKLIMKWIRIESKEIDLKSEKFKYGVSLSDFR